MTDKGAFLGTLRSALASGTPAPHRPFAIVATPPEVAPVWPDASASMPDRWTTAFEALGGHVHRTAESGLGAAVAEALAGRGPVLVDHRFDRRIFEDSAGGAPWLEWPACGLEVAAGARCGVIDATAGVAATGSVVIDTSRSGRLVSLLPQVAVFVVRASAVVPLAGDVLRRHGERWPEGPPSNVVVVTGPSRSGDIEMILAVGVHGPGEVHGVLVEDA